MNSQIAVDFHPKNFTDVDDKNDEGDKEEDNKEDNKNKEEGVKNKEDDKVKNDKAENEVINIMIRMKKQAIGLPKNEFFY